MKTKRVRKTCEKCVGVGMVSVPASLDENDYKTVACSTCRGKGFVYVRLYQAKG